MNLNFTPARWLPGPHAQTIGARVLRVSSGVNLRRERLELPDGDFLDLDWVVDGEEGGGPLVLVLHGLEGTARSTYMLEMYRALTRAGLAAVGLNFRSCSGEPNRLPRLYHSGDTGDLAHVLGVLRNRAPRPLGAMGFSLGGNALLKFLGEANDVRALPIQAAAAISVPFDLAAGEHALRRGAARMYLFYLLRKLRRKVRLKTALLRPLVDVDALLRARTFRDFDELGTAPLHGFHSADDYYARSSSGQFLTAISLPTAIIHALDDPFLPARAVPVETVRANPHLEAAILPRGGHVGFVCGAAWRPEFWAERAAAEFLAERLGAA